MDSIVTIDVEGHPVERTYECVDITESFINNTRGGKYTLFVTPDVVRNKTKTVARWIEQDHTIGLHIHPERFDGYDSVYLSEYSKDDLTDIITKGCNIFESYLGHKPVYFRAGRWEYSESLLSVLDNLDFDCDASLVPDYPVRPYRHNDLIEMPLSVYSGVLVRLISRVWGTSRAPLWADWFLQKTPAIPLYYYITNRIINSAQPYVMTAFHDYDLISSRERARTENYLNYLYERTECVNLADTRDKIIENHN